MRLLIREQEATGIGMVPADLPFKEKTLFRIVSMKAQ